MAQLPLPNPPPPSSALPIDRRDSCSGGAGPGSTPRDILAAMPDRRSPSTRLYGPAPPPTAPQSQMLRWIRRLSWRVSLWCVPLIVVGIIVSFPLWLWIALGVAAVIMLANQLVLSLRIRRLERSEQSR
jgi:hypothetical protein